MWAAQEPARPAAPAGQHPTLLSACQVNAAGTISPTRHLVIGLGVEWAHCHVTVIRQGDAITVIDTRTGEIVRELTIDPDRRYQPTGRPRGPTPGVTRRPRRIDNV